MKSVFKWLITRRPDKSPRNIPVVTSVPPPSVDAGSLLVTLINHSTVLLQLPGLNILTDPIWAQRCGPLGLFGPRRHRLPGVEIGQLPRLDAVLISHNHYDHLDLPTIRELGRRGGATFIVPLGVSAFLKSQGGGPVQELDWGDSTIVAGATIHAVPAIHFSGRTPFDRDQTLWCGYVVESAFGSVYFAADTAFGPHFAWIRDRFGPPRVALLPIGAYQPRSVMAPVHMDPDEALEAHRILGASISIPIHHGTFQLTDEGIDEPRRRLESCATPGSFRILDNGQSALFT